MRGETGAKSLDSPGEVGSSDFAALLHRVDPHVARILDRALSGIAVAEGEAVVLFHTSGVSLLATMLVADELRRRAVGDLVTYVTVRNVNFTNICFMDCRFCAFSRRPQDADAELLEVDQVADLAAAAAQLGCTELCLQGGINPALESSYYLRLVAAVKRRVPDLHVHAFSPFEVFCVARRAGLTIEEFLRALRDAGLGSMPGTAAEIFDPAVRRTIAPHKLSAAEWAMVVRVAHSLGIPTTATIMYGHVDAPEHWAAHLAMLRDIQRDTGGFTELVPLGFVHHETPLFRSGEARPGPTGMEDIRMHAVARIMLHQQIENVQVSWVKLGPKLAQLCLQAGANDFGGTLMEERISSSAGATHGDHMRPEEFRRLIRDLGRTPAQRTTTYDILRVFDAPE